jgi:hypothetical protein
VSLSREIGRDGEDASVVVHQPEPGRQDPGVGVIQFHLDRAAQFVDGQLGVQPAVLYAEVVQEAERLTGEVSQLRVMTLGLQLGDDDNRQDHQMLVEPGECGRIGEQDTGVEHVGTDLAAGPLSGRAGAPPGLAARCGR